MFTRYAVTAFAGMIVLNGTIHAQSGTTVSAANINVVQNSAANTAAAVTVTLDNSINDFRIRSGSNRGDFTVQIGSDPTVNFAHLRFDLLRGVTRFYETGLMDDWLRNRPE
jgi:autotransporter translocation and assembly factor TamB